MNIFLSSVFASVVQMQIIGLNIWTKNELGLRTEQANNTVNMYWQDKYGLFFCLDVEKFKIFDWEDLFLQMETRIVLCMQMENGRHSIENSRNFT